MDYNFFDDELDKREERIENFATIVSIAVIAILVVSLVRIFSSSDVKAEKFDPRWVNATATVTAITESGSFYFADVSYSYRGDIIRQTTAISWQQFLTLKEGDTVTVRSNGATCKILE